MNTTLVDAAATATTTTIIASLTSTPSSSASALPEHIPKHGNAVVAFIIGFAIVTLASVLNAAGLNLTKLDHVRTSVIPKSSRKKDWLRPLWLLGMLLYILSQIIGSTLALEYLRAEYVAPLGSSSLIFNFLFARFLVGTPVTNYDYLGTVTVILGVIGIVAFGSMNSGLDSDTSVTRLTYLWRRPGWLGFFFVVAIAISLLYMFVSTLDAVLAARQDLSAAPFSGRRRGPAGTSMFGKMKAAWETTNAFVAERLEWWTAAKDDKVIAWTLGIGWACCGGGLAGGTLVFAKAAVKLFSGSISHENEGNQFGHASAVFTLIFTAVTAVLQIICLNRGLKVYDSTLVVPVFYGVYTAAGFLDSLIFNDSIGAYTSWVLFAIFCSIVVLIAGVVLLTHKKPEPKGLAGGKLDAPPRSRRGERKGKGMKAGLIDGGDGAHDEDEDVDGEESHALRNVDLEAGGSTTRLAWTLGDASDDEDGDVHSRPHSPAPPPRVLEHAGHEEGRGLMAGADDDERPPHPHPERTHARVNSAESDETLANRAQDDGDEFGEWKDAGLSSEDGDRNGHGNGNGPSRT